MLAYMHALLIGFDKRPFKKYLNCQYNFFEWRTVGIAQTSGSSQKETIPIPIQTKNFPATLSFFIDLSLSTFRCVCERASVRTHVYARLG